MFILLVTYVVSLQIYKKKMYSQNITDVTMFMENLVYLEIGGQ